ncbi:MAG: TatD family hydrolase [Kiritimatiellae bacterium]|nr:TatD family hydrolase [Kiritimatiellia bacterium]
MNLYDTHAHFNLNPGESAAVMTRALEAGVTQLVAVGGSQDLNAGAIAVADAFASNVRLALGFDRSQANDADVAVYIETLRKLNELTPMAAIGETGLDFHYEADTADAQCELFAAQLALANEWHKPIIIHTREADEATLRVLDETPWSGEGLRGVIHCFTGTKEFAKELLDRNLAISFSGIVSFKNADMLRESAAFVPDDRLMIETDSPFLAPVPMRGNRNEPAFVKHVAECLAEVRGDTVDHIAEVTMRNAVEMFG